MKHAYILLLAAILGIVVAIIAVLNSNQPVSEKPPVVQPSQAPFPYSVAGAGLIEAGSGNIAIGTPVAGIVIEIYRKVGERVKAGEPLFRIDDRDLQAQLLVAAAKVREAEAILEKPRHRLKYTENLSERDSNVFSPQELSDLRDEVTAAESALALARAEVEQINREIERRMIRAPVAGQLLQIKTHLGEYAQEGSATAPLMLLGDDSRLHVRVDIDENDAWRVRPEAKALAFLRSSPGMQMPLQFEYIEPYVVPKTALTGQSTEWTDTRVLQVIYSFDRGELPVYIGQQVDVFIEAAPLLPSGSARTP